MAEGKNKIMVYADWIDSFEDLTDAEAGQLIKHFFKYVNDEAPEEIKDRVILASWRPIERTLKRDLKNWEGTKKDRSQAGALGNLKRYYPHIYKRVKDEEITLKYAKTLANKEKTSQNSQGEKKLAVTDTVTVTDTVNSLKENSEGDVEDIKTEPEDEQVKKLKYKNEDEFLLDWNDARKRILHKESNIKHLTSFELTDFRQLNKEFTISDFKNGIRGLMMQKGIFSSSTLRPKHFLSDRNIEKYIDAFTNNTQIYEDKKQQSRL